MGSDSHLGFERHVRNLKLPVDLLECAEEVCHHEIVDDSMIGLFFNVHAPLLSYSAIP